VGSRFLGICLGFAGALSIERRSAGELAGLGILQGKICALPSSVKLPHMGWNRLNVKRESQLLAGLNGDDDYFYFAHTFAASAANSETVAACEYGMEFGAVVEVGGRMCAVQFHPEKSGNSGAKLLGIFLRMAA